MRGEGEELEEEPTTKTSPMQMLRSLRWAKTRFSPKAPGMKRGVAEGWEVCQVG